MASAKDPQIRRAIPVLLIVGLLSVSAQARYAGGGGTADDPYQVATATDLIALGETPEDYDKHFVLTADIDLSALAFDTAVIAPDTDLDRWDFQGDAFTGVFDGAGHTIRHLTVDDRGAGGEYLGLFGTLSGLNAEIRNLGLENILIAGGDHSRYVGAVCAYNYRGRISNCSSTGAMSGGAYSNYIGGICGYTLYGSRISDCHSATTVTGDNQCSNLGGVCGYNENSTISHCHSSGTVTGSASSYYLGGLCGYNAGIYNPGSISDCYSTSDVTGGTESQYLGGLCGCNCGSIDNCHARGSVTGRSFLGGLCGHNNSGTITDCYSTGHVTGGDYALVGGLCGNNSDEISRCYSTGDVTGGDNSRLGGLCGKSDGVIANCCATGTVAGSECSPVSGSLGGLCGDNDGGHIRCSYAVGHVTGACRVGGLVGNGDRDIVDCFWDRQTSGQNTSAGGWSKTTAEMKSGATYTGWDDGSWTIDDGNDYPCLAWQNAKGTALSTVYAARTYPGAGNAEHPFEISSAEDLFCLSLRAPDWDKNIVLTASIDMRGKPYYPINDFSGHFDGQGFSIGNLTIDANVVGSRNGLGLFGYVSGVNAEIKNLSLKNISITGRDYSNYLGAVCGFIERGTISHCHATGTVTGGAWSCYLGGVCGYNSHGSINNCHSIGQVGGGMESEYLGGLCGINDYGSLSQCHSVGRVTGGTGSYCLGGLCGDNYARNISQCYSEGSVDGDSEIGGLCGRNLYGTISDCYAGGAAEGNYRVGGLCGYNEYASISNCYATGLVSGLVGKYSPPKNLGGLVGRSNSTKGSITTSFWDMESSGQATSDGGTEESTAQMQMSRTFLEANWDFVDETENGNEDLWWIDEGQDYPHLWWELLYEEPNDPDIVQSSAPVHRLWSPAYETYFYTIDEAEKDAFLQDAAAGWEDDGTAYYAYDDANEPNVAPVYRFHSAISGAYFYTIDEAEKNYIVQTYPTAWTYERIAFYAFPVDSQPAGAAPVHRFWSAASGCHFYTIDEDEKNTLINEYSDVWTYEGTAWYAFTTAP